MVVFYLLLSECVCNPLFFNFTKFALCISPEYVLNLFDCAIDDFASYVAIENSCHKLLVNICISAFRAATCALS